MIFVIMLIFLLLIFPIFISFSILYDKNINKLFVTINLFRKLKIISGYIQIKEKLIFFHLQNKAFIINPKEILSTSFKFHKIKHFELSVIKSCLIVGDFNELSASVLLNYNYFLNVFICIIKMYKNFINVKNDIVITEENNFKFLFKIEIVFNILVVVIILLKKLMELIINAKKSRKYNRKSN